MPNGKKAGYIRRVRLPFVLKVKVHTNQVAYQTGANLSFCRMKRLGLFQTSFCLLLVAWFVEFGLMFGWLVNCMFAF